jgi:hypothetical protein
MRLQCLKGRTCTNGTSWNVEGSDEDYSFLLKGSANDEDITPKQRRQFAEQVLELLEGSDRYWTVEDIREELRRETRLSGSEGLVRRGQDHQTDPCLYWRSPEIRICREDFLYFAHTPPLIGNNSANRL